MEGFIMKVKHEILKALYSMDRTSIFKQEDGSFVVRGCFSLQEGQDDIKRFIFLKRHTPGLSYMRFKSLPFLKNTIYIDLPAQKIEEKDYEKIKLQLWYKLSVYLSHKIDQALLPKMVFI